MSNKIVFGWMALGLCVALLFGVSRHIENQEYLKDRDQRSVARFGISADDWQSAVKLSAQALNATVESVSHGREVIPSDELYGEASAVRAAAIMALEAAFSKAPCPANRKELSDSARDVIDLFPTKMLDDVDKLAAAYSMVAKLRRSKCGAIGD